MPRAKTGEAISAKRRTRKERRRLQRLLDEAESGGDLKTWRRAKAIIGYLEGKRVVVMAEELGVTRGSINRWLQWFNAKGADGLRTRKAPGRARLLTESQCKELVATIEAGPQAAGFETGVWTGPMIGDWIRRHFGVKYHNQYIPRLLHKLGFSVQRPRKRLAKADKELQEYWVKKRLPAIKKKPLRAAV